MFQYVRSFVRACRMTVLGRGGWEPAGAVAGVLGLTVAAVAQPATGTDFQWATIGAPGNAAYTGPSAGGIATGRGSVAAEFRISTLEVSTAQWLEFANFAGALNEPFRIGDGPVGGYEPDPTYAGPGRRYRLSSVSSAAQLPVYGISWLNAARYCNWLHNDKGMASPSLSALAGGAYDTSTFGPSTTPPGGRTDALTRSPGARYFIPTLDEWMKAVYFQPAIIPGPIGAGSWRTQPNGSDTPLVAGLIGTPGAQTNAGLASAPASSLVLGGYSTTRSPWGLLDASGGASEWLEDVDDPQDRLYRLYAGSSAFDPFLNPLLLDTIGGVGASLAAGETSYIGLRLASAIPDPSGGFLVGCLCGATIATRRRRRCPSPHSPPGPLPAISAPAPRSASLRPRWPA